MTRVILNSGSELTSVGEGLMTQMIRQFEEDRLQIPLENGPLTVLTATGLPVKITHKTVPIAVSLRTPWGAVDAAHHVCCQAWQQQRGRVLEGDNEGAWD